MNIYLQKHEKNNKIKTETYEIEEIDKRKKQIEVYSFQFQNLLCSFNGLKLKGIRFKVNF